MEDYGVFLLPAALAHSPHDVVPFVSVAADGSFATVEDEAIALSPDGWSVRWIGAAFGTPDCVFARGAESVVALVGGEGTWDTEDLGESWSFRGGPTDARRCIAAEGALWVAGDEGVWTSADGVEWGPIGPELSLIDLAIDPEAPAGWQVFALAEDGALYALAADGLAWTRRAEGPFRRVAAGGGAVLLAPESGPILRLNGEALVPLSEGPTEVFVLAVGEAWLAATAEEAVWVSRDDGASWTLEAEGIEPPSVGVGSPGDGVHYEDLVAHDDGWWLASWEGLFFKDPDAARWSQVPLRTIPLVNTLHWLGEELLVGTNGGGLYRGVPGSADWTDVSRDIGWPWMRQLAVSPDGGAWFVGAGDVLYASFDQGESWEVPPVHLPTGGDVTLVSPNFVNDGRALFGGVDADGRGVMAWSADSGARWTSALLSEDCREKPAFGAMTATLARVSCGRTIYESSDGGERWAALGRVGSGPTGLLADPAGGFWIGTRSGLYRAEVGSPPELIDFEGDFITALALTPTGEPLVAIRGVGLVGSAGLLPGWPASEPVEALAIAANGAIAVGSHLGLSVSTDGGQSFSLACPYDRYDDDDPSWIWAGWAEQSLDRAKAGGVHAGVVGSTASWTVEGEGLTLIGAAAQAALEVEIDGEVYAVQVGNTPIPTRIFAINLPPGRHALTLRVSAGELRLDGGERWRWDAPDFGPQTEVVEERCGCRGGSSAWALILLGVWRRRRARDLGLRSPAEETANTAPTAPR